MAQRLVGLAVLLCLLLIFAPWLYSLNPPVPLSKIEIPAQPHLEPSVVPAPVADDLSADAVLSALGVDGVEASARANASKSARALRQAKARGKEHYRVRAGVFRSPGRAALRLSSAGYPVETEKYKDTAKGTLYALYVGGVMTQEAAGELIRTLDHRYEIEALKEKYQP